MTHNQIVINNLSKAYDNGFNALKNINLNIKKGEKVAIGKKKKKIKKGYIEYPCKKYPKSYALKHWQLGKSWSVPTEYYTDD